MSSFQLYEPSLGFWNLVWGSEKSLGLWEPNLGLWKFCGLGAGFGAIIAKFRVSGAETWLQEPSLGLQEPSLGLQEPS